MYTAVIDAEHVLGLRHAQPVPKSRAIAGPFVDDPFHVDVVRSVEPVAEHEIVHDPLRGA